jgi:hypothetical protein
MNAFIEVCSHFPLATGLYIGIASVAISAIGAGISAYGQHQAANAAEDAAARQATEQRLQARKEAEVAAENARRAEQEKTRALAAQMAALAGNGLALEGTPLAVLGDTALTLEMEILDIAHQSAMRQRQLLAGAKTAEIEGKAAASALRISGTATAVSGVGDALGSGYQVSRDFAPKSSTAGSSGSGGSSTGGQGYIR